MLHGGAGGDTLTGGGGAKVFRFTSVQDTTPSKSGRDTITDFHGADRIDLSAIDANSKARGDQAFTFVGSGKFSMEAGQLRYDKGKSGSYVRADVDGDGKSDFSIDLDGALSIVKADFIL